MRVKRVKSAGIQPVYNMTVDEYHNYIIVGGVVLKNCDALRYFSVTRTLRSELPAPEEDYFPGEEEEVSYDDEMTGGDFDDTYFDYGG